MRQLQASHLCSHISCVHAFRHNAARDAGNDYVSDRLLCRLHSRDVASAKSIVWEGYMSARQPARLFRDTVNVDRCPLERRVRLSCASVSRTP